MSGSVGGVGVNPLPTGIGAQAPRFEGIVGGDPQALIAAAPGIATDPAAAAAGTPAPPGIGSDAAAGAGYVDPVAVLSGNPGTADASAGAAMPAGALVDPALAGNSASPIEFGTTGLAAGVPKPVIDAIVAKALIEVLGAAATGIAGIETDPAAAAAAAQAQLGMAPTAAEFSGTLPAAQTVAGAQLSNYPVAPTDPAAAALATAPATPAGAATATQLSASAQQFVSTLLSTDPAAMTPQIATQLNAQWTAVPAGERAALRNRILSEIVGPASQKLQELAADPAVAGDAQAQANAQAIGQALATINQIVAS